MSWPKGTVRMDTPKALAALRSHQKRLRAFERELGITPERMGLMALQWPLDCVIRELEIRSDEERVPMREAV